MRTSLTIFAIAALCFGQDAFAQAKPKEVVVVDGQVAVSNLPESQTVNGTVSVDNLPDIQDVWVQGATNPIPVAVIAAPQTELLHSYNLTDRRVTNSHRSAAVSPLGKLFNVKYLGVMIDPVDVDTDVLCFANFSTDGPIIATTTALFEMSYTRAYNGVIAHGTMQFSDFPPMKSVGVLCNILSRDAPVERASEMTFSYSGYLVDAPTP